MPSSVRLGGWILAGLALAGCAEEWGPEPLRTTTVRGRVTVAGRPLEAGWIEFLPVDGTVGVLRSAPLGADGRFRAGRVPIGDVGIRVVGAPDLPGLDPRLAALLRRSAQVYAIRRHVPPGGSPPPLEIDLAVEAVRAARAGG